jgi:hypothetical protein
MTPFRENVLGTAFGNVAWRVGSSLVTVARRSHAGFPIGKVLIGTMGYPKSTLALGITR